MEQSDQPSRVLRSKAEAQRLYDHMSRWYDAVAGSSEHRYVLSGLDRLDPQEGETILEIGFGTGRALVELAHRVGPSGKVYGIDLSEGMRQASRVRIARASVSERVELRCGDAAQLPFADNFFDAVFTGFTLELFDTPEIPIVLQECKRVLRGGGRIGVVGMSACGRRTWMTDLYAWAHRKFPTWVDCRPIFVERAERGGYACDECESCDNVGAAPGNCDCRQAKRKTNVSWFLVNPGDVKDAHPCLAQGGSTIYWWSSPARSR